ncbi:Lrp/AsnC family transcriptional regulator (plasmid) [Halolamina sp. CBA1230]|uniref:Lrp/AsnC family transcriptional regulator n=1 Tax=Halolamina sp. CBA1230 TaxID=1853690 RepID=UPI0009A22432|nr:Lrp/AsnC family transcriptional regulator [Halolamina sp. CBA1230]QKY21786.1 Lrp/AsnC family transcriptional regulator [Halolamina sp. CBA1230]
MSESPFDAFDAIDTQILVILSEDPRMSYQKLSRRLADEGYEMSAEGVRRRVTDLMAATTPFFLLDPERLAWEIVRISVRATDGPGDKAEAFDRIADLPFWHVTKGIGTYDIYGVGMAPTLADVEEMVSEIRGYDCVARIDFIVVTDRRSDLEDYYRQGLREGDD